MLSYFPLLQFVFRYGYLTVLRGRSYENAESSFSTPFMKMLHSNIPSSIRDLLVIAVIY